MTERTIGRIEYSPVYRVRYSTDPSIQPLQKPINASAEAVVQLQTLVDEMLTKIEAMNRRLDELEGLVTP